MQDVTGVRDLMKETPKAPQGKREMTISEKLHDISKRMCEVKQFSFELTTKLFDKENQEDEIREVSCLLDLIEKIEDDQKKAMELLQYINSRM